MAQLSQTQLDAMRAKGWNASVKPTAAATPPPAQDVPRRTPQAALGRPAPAVALSRQAEMRARIEAPVTHGELAGLRVTIADERAERARAAQEMADLKRQYERVAARVVMLETRIHDIYDALASRLDRLQTEPARLEHAESRPAPRPEGKPPATARQTPHADSVAGRIRAARERHELSRIRLAETLRVSPALIYLWERGDCRPTRQRVPALAAALGVEPASLGLAA